MPYRSNQPAVAPPYPARHDPYGATDNSPEAIEFGRLLVDGQRTVRLRYSGENHAVIFGKAGSGKDTRLLIPSLLSMHGKRSVVAVDPKGEMAAVTAPQRAKYGRVVILNPFGVLCDHQGYDYMEGCGFNPLCALSPHSPDFNKDAGLLAEALIPMTGKEKDPFFPLMARALVGGLIMYEVVKAKEQNRLPFLFNVRRMICEASAEGIPPSNAFPGLPPQGIPAYAQEMASSLIIGMRNKGGQFINWNKEIHSVASTARAETEFLDDPEMARCLAQNGFDFREVKERPTSVYLVLPMEVMHRHGKWLRMVLTSALQACMRPRGVNAPRTLFIFNEFAALGHLQLIEDNFTVVRGAGIQMIPVLQDLNQLQHLYDKRWQTFIANADITATFAPNDTETAEWFSKRSGETARLKINVTETYSSNSGNSQNTGLSPTGETSGLGVSGGSSYGWNAAHSMEKVPFVTPYELYSMQPGEMRIIRAGMGDTLHAHALPYYQMRNTVAPLAAPNPYAPDANIPRVPRRMPDYEAFQRQMLGAFQPVRESGGGAFGFTDPFASEPVDSGIWESGSVNDQAWDAGWVKTDIFDEMFGRPPPPPPPPGQSRPQAQDNIRSGVQARHPGYTPDPAKTLPNPAARHPGYTPDPPPERGGDDWCDDSKF